MLEIALARENVSVEFARALAAFKYRNFQIEDGHMNEPWRKSSRDDPRSTFNLVRELGAKTDWTNQISSLAMLPNSSSRDPTSKIPKSWIIGSGRLAFIINTIMKLIRP